MNAPVLIQGAMEIELSLLLSACENLQKHETDGFLFYTGHLSGISAVLSLTGMGMANAAAATVAGYYQYRPGCIINQGTAGAHRRELLPGAVIIGESAVCIHNIRTFPKNYGQGSDPFGWELCGNPVSCDPGLLRAWSVFSAGRQSVRIGRIGSGDVYNREADRIRDICQKAGTDCEDMETAAVYQICKKMNIPCIGLRVISNNELCGKDFDEKTARIPQALLLDYLKK